MSSRKFIAQGVEYDDVQGLHNLRFYDTTFQAEALSTLATIYIEDFELNNLLEVLTKWCEAKPQEKEGVVLCDNIFEDVAQRLLNQEIQLGDLSPPAQKVVLSHMASTIIQAARREDESGLLSTFKQVPKEKIEDWLEHYGKCLPLEGINKIIQWGRETQEPLDHFVSALLVKLVHLKLKAELKTNPTKSRGGH